VNRARPVLIYALVAIVGTAAFLYPFWIPSDALPARAHSVDAPLWAALVGGLVVAAVMLEIRRGTMNGATVAILGVLSAAAGLLRLVDLPGNNAGIFFLVVLAAAAFGPRFGLLLGISSMAVSAVITGGIGPWLPFQMLALGAMGAGAGAIDPLVRRFGLRGEVLALAAYGWVWGFAYGAVMNLWSWPLLQGPGPTQWQPGLGLGATLQHYWAYYVATSLAWDAAGALFNALLIIVTGAALLPSLRRFAHRLEPAVEWVPAPTATVIDA
jgi:energy-coupling factor transport system substrate-specific component